MIEPLSILKGEFDPLVDKPHWDKDVEIKRSAWVAVTAVGVAEDRRFRLIDEDGED